VPYPLLPFWPCASSGYSFALGLDHQELRWLEGILVARGNLPADHLQQMIAELSSTDS
jgi:hypothetical protein